MNIILPDTGAANDAVRYFCRHSQKAPRMQRQSCAPLPPGRAFPLCLIGEHCLEKQLKLSPCPLRWVAVNGTFLLTSLTRDKAEL